jgi:chromosome segregation ATPase
LIIADTDEYELIFQKIQELEKEMEELEGHYKEDYETIANDKIVS